MELPLLFRFILFRFIENLFSLGRNFIFAWMEIKFHPIETKVSTYGNVLKPLICKYTSG